MFCAHWHLNFHKLNNHGWLLVMNTDPTRVNQHSCTATVSGGTQTGSAPTWIIIFIALDSLSLGGGEAIMLIFLSMTPFPYAPDFVHLCCYTSYYSLLFLLNHYCNTGFVRHTMSCMPDEACDRRNIALNYQVNCWCARLSKGTILLSTQHA